MDSINLIKDELEVLSSLIEGIEIRYEFKRSISTHLIEVKPIDLFNSNKLYIEKEIELEEKFSELFPNEDLVFVTEDSLSKIENPDLILPCKIAYKQEQDSFYSIDVLLKGLNMEVYGEINYALAA